MAKKKSTHGGRRDGAGRPGQDRIAKGVRLRPETVKKIEESGLSVTSEIIRGLKLAGYDNP